MDKAYDVGSIKIFSALAANAVREFDVNARHVSFDTTSVNVCGDHDLSCSLINITTTAGFRKMLNNSGCIVCKKKTAWAQDKKL